MSNHLRHCPKHKKPLPCAHCAPAAKPSQGSTTGPPQPASDPWPERVPLPSLSGPTDAERKAKEAERGRERRKLRREQLAAVKLAFTAEGREAIRKARILKHALTPEGSNQDMARGKFTTDAPTGKGLIEYSGNIELAGAAADRAAALGPRNDPGYWPERDRRHVVPKGAGPRSDEKPDPDAKEENKVRIDRDSGVLLPPTARTIFTVKPGTDLDVGQALINLFHRVFLFADDYICRLCYRTIPSERLCMDHLEQFHGCEDEPKHDIRFGDVVATEVLKVRSGRRKLEKTKESSS